MVQNSPVVIVGAGVAGLAAAAKLGQSGIPVIVLEARNRVGGRIFTQHDAVCNASVELGAEFIHGLPPEIWSELDESTIEEVKGQPWCVSNNRLCSCDFFSQVDSILKDMDDSLPDESFLSFLERRFPNPSHNREIEEAKQHAVSYVSGFNAADPNLVSVHWLVAGTKAEEKNQGHRTFRPKNGYVDLIDTLCRRVARHEGKIQTGAIVESILWKPGNAQVKFRVENGSSTLEATQVLVTLPLSLLKTFHQPGSIEFTPALPQEKGASLDKLEMGKVIRIVLRFSDRFWDTISPIDPKAATTLSNMSFLFSDDESFPTWWTTLPLKRPLITGWAPFNSGDRLSGLEKEAVVRDALFTLSRLLRVPNLEHRLEAAYVHDWQADPFSRGAYSYAKVGADGAQAALAAPIENTLFFAGEATDISGNNGTVHGAITGGHRAAQEIMDLRSR